MSTGCWPEDCGTHEKISYHGRIYRKEFFDELILGRSVTIIKNLQGYNIPKFACGSLALIKNSAVIPKSYKPRSRPRHYLNSSSIFRCVKSLKGYSIPADFIFHSITKTDILSFSPLRVAFRRRGHGIRGPALNPIPL